MSPSARRIKNSSAFSPRFISFLIISPFIITVLLKPFIPTISPVQPVANNIVISQVYGGGGNSGSTLKSDYIELFNPGTSAVDITDWSVQYHAATGATAWQVTPLCPSGTCMLAPGEYFLVQEATGAGGTTDLPTADAVGTIPMSATAGRVALVSSPAALTVCPAGAIDLVGYGGADCFEGSGPTSSPNNTIAVLRNNNGCLDTDNNSSDFAPGIPNPRNSSSSSIVCGVSPSPSPTPTPAPTPGCGVERWSIKTGTDADASLVDPGSPQATTIVTMRGWPAPSQIPLNSRVSPYETTVWVINGTLTNYKLEDDSDYHLVISDDAGNTVITEIPLAACIGATSPFKSSIANARAQFDARFTATTSFQTTSVAVQIKGVGMFDFLHGQTGVAPNGIELHPVIDITFPTPSPSPTPPVLQLLGDQSGPAADQVAALDSELFLRDPFPVINRSNVFNQGLDRNTRAIIFVTNLQLAPGESAASVVVHLIDSNNQSYDVAAEDVRPVTGSGFTQVIFRLPDNLVPGSCTVRIEAHAQVSNPGVMRIRI